MENRKSKTPGFTPEQLAEDEDLMRFCEAAALQLAQMLDREEAEAGLPDPYSLRTIPQRRIKRKSVESVVKKDVEK